MMPRILAALAVFLSAVTHMHLTVNAGIATVTVSVPWFILGALIAACAFVAFMIVRALTEPRVPQRYQSRSPSYVIHGRVL